MMGRSGNGGGVRGRSGGGGEKYRNACITMHQPWASLLVHGIKRVEGRSWPSPITGRLWIHAASKVPDPDTVKAMENFYREIYAVNGISDIKFPEHYPVSRLLGCVEVVGCLKCEELVCWEAVPESVRLEGLTDYCWLCERPQKLLVPFEMRGFQGVYNLEKRIYDAAVRGLRSVEGPQPVKFLLPDLHNPLSLRPGSLASHFSSSKVFKVEKTPNISAAIAGARAAATQFSNKEQTRSTIKNHDSGEPSQSNSLNESRRQSSFPNQRLSQGYPSGNHVEQHRQPESQSTSSNESRRQSSFPNQRLSQGYPSGSHVEQHRQPESGCTSTIEQAISMVDINTVQNRDSGEISQSNFSNESGRQSGFPNQRLYQGYPSDNHVEQHRHSENGRSTKGDSRVVTRGFSQQPGAPSFKLFAAAMKGLQPD